MTERKRVLRARYRAAALEQLAQLAPTIAALRDGTADVEAERALGRALHTLKGDASLVGLAEISAALHAAEDRATEKAWAEMADLLAAIGRDLVKGEDPASSGAAAGMTIPPAILQVPPPSLAGSGQTTQTMSPRAGGAGEDAPTQPKLAAPGGAEATAQPKLHPPTEPKLHPPTEPKLQAPGQPSSAPAAPAAASRQRWVRLQTDVLDDLSDRLLALSMAYGRLLTSLGQVSRDAPTPALRDLVEEADSVQRQLDDAVGAAWALRLVSVEEGLHRLADHAVDLARSLGKKLRVRVDGGRAELERSTLDAIEQPLVHLIRNAVDHGIEDPGARGTKPAEATLVLEARAIGGTVEIAVEDDGRGIDPDRVRAAAVTRGVLGADEASTLSDEATFDLLFLHGFSTKSQASALSGRGVGLDAVRGKIEGLGGAVRLSSRPGQGARFVLSVPAAIARERAVVVETASGAFALPSRVITALIRLGDFPRREVAGGMAVEHGGAWAPLRGLDEVLGFGGGAGAGAVDDDLARDHVPALVLDAAGRRHVFAVDRIDGEHDLLRRPVDELLGRSGMVTASSVLDDGRVALWPSVPALVRGIRARIRGTAVPSPVRRARRVLVVDDSPVVRDLVSSILRTADLIADTAVDGEAAFAALERAQPDLVLSDVEMPRLDGFGLLQRVREKWPRLPMVMLTTRGSEEDRRRAAALGADAYLIKAEFEEGRLVDTVQRLIGNPA